MAVIGVARVRTVSRFRFVLFLNIRLMRQEINKKLIYQEQNVKTVMRDDLKYEIDESNMNHS